MSLTVLNPVVYAGDQVQVRYSFGKPKSGGVIGIAQPDLPGCYGVEGQCDAYYQVGGAIHQLAQITGQSGTVTLQAPPNPATYTLFSAYKPDGGTLDIQPLIVQAAPAAIAAPLIVAAAAAATPAAIAAVVSYVPPAAEPGSSDGQRLSMQDGPTQSYYLANYGPGLLAATQFVIDHQHQLAALGAALPGATTYTPPVPEPAATDGVRLSDQAVDMQSYYVTGFGPGILAASQFVRDHNAQIGTGPVTLAANGGAPGGQGAATGAAGVWTGGATGWGSTTTPTVANQRQTGAAPPTVGGVLATVTGNPLLLAAIAAGAYFMLKGGHRR